MSAYLTKQTRGSVTKLTLLRLMLAAMLTLTFTSFGATIAFWTFEGDGVNTPTNGMFLKDTDGRVAPTADGVLAIDVSGNGNSLYTWDNTAAGHQYRTNVPAPIVPQTGTPNNFSIQNNGANPTSMTWSTNTLPTVDLETIEPLAWTIEASIYQTATATHETFVGRDGNSETNIVVSSRAPLYFKTFNGLLQILFTDVAGNVYDLSDTTGTLSLNTWYNVAAVSDGTTLSLYKDSGAGYVLVGSMALTPGDTRLNYDNDNSSTPGDEQWGWSVGRGRFGASDAQIDGHVDRFLGNIDNVRISDAALDPTNFLHYSTNVFIVSGPTPAAQTVAIGNPFSFTIVAGGEPTLNYQWRKNGTPISGANSATYNVAVSVIGDLGNYDVVITNAYNSVTSAVAVLSIHVPRPLTWGGVSGAWDTTSANWTTNNGGSFLAYIETDNVRFDVIGSAQPVVTLNAVHSPSSVVVSNASYSIAGANIASSGSLGLSDNASLTLSNVNSFASGTILTGNSTLHLRAVNTLGPLLLDSTSTVQLNGVNQTAASLSGGGVITSTNGAPVLTYGGNNLNSTWSGSITTNGGGNTSFIKVGTGTNTITGTNYLAGGASQINGGAVIVPAGGALLAGGAAEFWVAQNAGTGHLEINGGTLTANNWLVAGRNAAGANGTLVINSGTINKTGGGNIIAGSLGATGTIIVNGGQVLNNSMLLLGENATANGTLRLNGGLIQATQIRSFGVAPLSSVAYFNGGTLQAVAASADFIMTPSIGAISAGGLNFDNNGFDITIASMLVEDVVTPSTGGGVTKLGAGTLTLSGGYNYTGTTVVRGGTLSLNPGLGNLISSPNLVVSNASLTLASGVAALAATDVTLGNSAVLNFNYGTIFANPAVAAIAATGNLTAPGTTITINVSANGLVVGTVPLITYGGATLGSIANFVLGPLPPGVTANLVNGVNSLNLNITATGQNLSWYGNVDNVWNINGTANWQNSLVPGAKYLEYGPTGDPVRFDDTALGNFDVNLPANVHPFSVIAGGTLPYSITGAGGITGATSLIKSNTGTLFVGTANTYSGGTFVNGGTLAISNNAALGNNSVAATLAGGTLQLNHGTTIATRPVTLSSASFIGVPAAGTSTIGSTISGAGALTKVDAGTLNISGSNNFTGVFTNSIGTVNFSGTNIATVAAGSGLFVGSTPGVATLNMPAGAALNRFEVKLGNVTGAKGIINMTNATLTGGTGEFWIGGSVDNVQTDGEFNLVGGSVTANSWMAVGRSFGASGSSKGVLNIIGGAWTNQTANNVTIGSALNCNGKVNISNGGIFHVGSAAVNIQMWVGEAGNGIMNIDNSTVIANRPGNPAMAVGRGGNGAGSIRLNSGMLNSADQTYIGHGTGTVGSYGEINQSGGIFVSRWFLVVGLNNDRSIYRQSGGAFFITNRFMTIGAGGTGSIGVADLSGGTFTAFDAAGDGGIYVAEAGVGTLNVRGTSQVSVTGTATGGGLRIGNGVATRGIVNLNTGGTITANRVSRGNQGAVSAAILNFNGGRLNARMNNATFLTNITSAFVHAGGATIDDGGFAVNVAQPLLAPTDLGVTSIAMTSGGSNYIGAPIIQVAGGTGTNCTAVANMIDDGSGNGTYSVGSITITGPGTYTVAPTTVNILLGGQNRTLAVAGAITTAANTSGGLTKLGNGTTTFSGANTYTGLTTVSNGTLNVNGSVASAVTVKSGATLGGTGTIAGAVTAESGATVGAGLSIGTLTLSASPLLNAGSTIVAELNRTNVQTADRINVTGNPIAYNGTLVLKNIGLPLQVGNTFTLFNASSYSGSFTLVSQTLGQVVTWNTSQLAVNGTVSVAAVAQVSINSSVSGSTLNLTWPPNQLGMTLQTNSVSVVAPASWFALPGSASVTNVNITIDPNLPNVFFRLVAP